MFSKLKKLAETVSDSLSQKANQVKIEKWKNPLNVSDTSIKETEKKEDGKSDTISNPSTCTFYGSGSTIASVSSSDENKCKNFEDNGSAAYGASLDWASSDLSSEKVVAYFEERKKKYADVFSSSSFMDKIAKFAKKTGIQFIYKATLLYYGLKSEEIPSSNKLIAMAGLGYFITPFDVLADVLPGGFIDDGFVLSFALDQVYSSLSNQTKEDAKIFLHEIFGEFNDGDL